MSHEEVYLFERADNNIGIMSCAATSIRIFQNAEACNYIPVMMFNSRNYYSSACENLWELCFEQPFSAQLKDLDLNGISLKKKYDTFGIPDFCQAADQLQFGKDRMFAKKYLRPSLQVKERIDYFFRRKSPDNVIGVFIRGTDYTRLRPKDHPVQPALDDVFAQVDARMVSRSYIYLVTEDSDIQRKFRERYGNSLLDKPLFQLSYSGIPFRLIKYEIQKRFSYSEFKEMLVQYTADVFILSRLQSIVCSMASASIIVRLLSDAEDSHFFDYLGKY